MNEALLQFKRDFGVYGSWAVWDNKENIESVLQMSDFQNILKPNIIFLGLNASMKIPVDWINYHAECGMHTKPSKKPQSWENTPVRRLAEVLQGNEFKSLRGAYMSDVVKTSFDGNSAITAEKVKDENIKLENINLLKRELDMLLRVSGFAQFHIICIRGKSYEIVKDAIKNGLLDGNGKFVHKIYHYSQPWRNKDEEIRRRIREDLLEVIKNMTRVNII